MTSSDADTALYIIPARGGSKGIPRKNIKEFCGHPLIAYTIDAALAVAPAERVILSTDDDEILAVARQCGLPVAYRRPDCLGGDKVGSREVMLDVMRWADAQGLSYDKVVLLQPTSPLRTPDDIRGALALFRPGVDMVVSVSEAACNPYYDCFETDADGVLHVSKGSGRLTRRQDAPKAWQYNGAVYVISPDALRAKGLGEFDVRIPFEMPRERSVDLDTPLDWTIAEHIANALTSHNI